MSALAAALEGAAIGAVQVGVGYLQRKLESGSTPTASDATAVGQQLIGLAVATGASLDGLRSALEEAGRRRQDARFESAKVAEIGELEGDGT